MNKNVRIYRSTMRGLRKCTYCGHYNGNRAKGCANEKCSLHYLKKSSDRRKPLIDAVQLISHNDTKMFSVRVKDRDPTNRNFVQIKDITLTADQDGSIVSRDAICFVDTCKYDSTDLNISCKHVKSASECTKQALEVKILKNVLYAMNITSEQKESLWSQYFEHAQTIPAVQRVNKSTFVVKCKVNTVQAAGRLHVTVSADDENEFTYSCGCKKLRIVLSPNNSVVMENVTCDHLILILAGILSSEVLQKDYQKFLNALGSLWVAQNFDYGNNLLQTEDLISFSENILNSCIELTPNENQRIFDSDPTMHTSADNVMEDEEIQLINLPTSNNELNAEFETTNMELAECQIELMDQFKLTNQIDLCNEDIQLCEADLFSENHIVCNVDAMTQDVNSQEVFGSESCDMITTPSNDCNDMVIQSVFENEKPPNRTLQAKVSPVITTPSLEFDSWLNFVIERVNSAIDFNSETTVVVQSYDVKQEFFSHLSCKFSVGDKRRIPNNTTLIKKGKHKGLVKSTWIFTNASTVKRIFTSKDACIDLEQAYMEKTPGYFVPYDMSSLNGHKSDVQAKKLKRILPSMFKAFVQFGPKGKSAASGLAIEWIPNVFPKSYFGVMRIQFSLGFKKNNKLIDKNSVTS